MFIRKKFRYLLSNVINNCKDMRKKINISAEHQKTLIEEFGVSRQTIYAALCYHTFSDLAKKIRVRAKALLEQEISSIKEEVVCS